MSVSPSQVPLGLGSVPSPRASHLAAVTSTQISWVYLLLAREKATLEMHTDLM